MPPLEQLQQQTGNTPTHRIAPRWVTFMLVLFSLVGFADATYLTIDHYQNIAPPCFVGSCEAVLTSVYSTFAGLPVSVFGMAFYFFILVALFAHINAPVNLATGMKSPRSYRAALAVTPIGFLASLYFFCIQAFVLHQFCQYCLLSATTSTVLFIIAIYVFARRPKTMMKL